MTKQEIKKVIGDHRDILKKYKVKSIALFGSYVRNEQKDNSDIDFIVDFEDPTYDNLINLAFFLEDVLKKKVEVIPDGGISPYIEPYIKEEMEKIETE